MSLVDFIRTPLRVRTYDEWCPRPNLGSGDPHESYTPKIYKREELENPSDGFPFEDEQIKNRPKRIPRWD